MTQLLGLWILDEKLRLVHRIMRTPFLLPSLATTLLSWMYFYGINPTWPSRATSKKWNEIKHHSYSANQITPICVLDASKEFSFVFVLLLISLLFGIAAVDHPLQSLGMHPLRLLFYPTRAESYSCSHHWQNRRYHAYFRRRLLRIWSLSSITGVEDCHHPPFEVRHRSLAV